MVYSSILHCANLLCLNYVVTYVVLPGVSGSYAFNAEMKCRYQCHMKYIPCGYYRTWYYFRSYRYCRLSLSETGVVIWTEKPIPLRQSSTIIYKRNNITIKTDTNNPEKAWERFLVAEARRNLKEC